MNTHEFTDSELAALGVPREAFDDARASVTESPGMSVVHLCASITASALYPRRMLRRIGTDSPLGRVAVAAIKVHEADLVGVEPKMLGNDGPSIYCTHRCTGAVPDQDDIGHVCKYSQKVVQVNEVCPIWAVFVAERLGF